MINKLTLPSGGLSSIIHLKKEISGETEVAPTSAKIVKLRFTGKQFALFQDACRTLEVLQINEKFISAIIEAIGQNVSADVVRSQLLKPIVDSQYRIVGTNVKKNIRSEKSVVRSQSAFTRPVATNERVIELLESLGGNVKLDKLHCDQRKMTCMIDVRLLLNQYFVLNNDKIDDGIIVDSFIRHLAPVAFADTVNNIVPKGNRKIIMRAVVEILRPF